MLQRVQYDAWSSVVLVAKQIEAACEVNISVCPGENEDEKLNEVMYEAWRFNRDCKLLREGLQGLSWDGQYHFIWSLSGRGRLSFSIVSVMKQLKPKQLFSTLDTQEKHVSPPSDIIIVTAEYFSVFICIHLQ